MTTMQHKPALAGHSNGATAVSQAGEAHGFTDAVREAAARGSVAVGLGAIAVIHALDSVGKWGEVRYMFWMYMALIVVAMGLAASVLFSRSRSTLLAAAALAAAVIAGFVINRTVGLPNATDDIGNWTEPLGLASLVVESFVVAVGLGGYLSARR